MPFKDTEEGSTHHNKDSCYKCHECNGHYQTAFDLHNHVSESVQCSDFEHVCCDGECNHDDCCGKVSENCPNFMAGNGGHGTAGGNCNHLMFDTGKYERECKFCGLIELRAD